MCDQVSRRHPRRDHPRGPERPGGLRDGHDDRPRDRPRRDHDDHLHRLPGRSSATPSATSATRRPSTASTTRRAGRWSPSRSSRRTSRRASTPRSRSAATPRPRRARRRRPGNDVRVRLPRDAGADAAADRARPPDGAPAGRGPQVAASCRTCAPTARPRSPSSTSAACPKRVRTVVVSAQHDPDVRPTGSGTTSSRRSSCRSIPRELRDDRPGHARQPDRPVRDRRADGRRRADRPQDHRGLVRRHGPPRRRRVLAARIRRRSTARRPTRRAGSPRTSSPPGLADRFEVEVAYGIGIARPISLSVETFGTGRIADDAIQA